MTRLSRGVCLIGFCLGTLPFVNGCDGSGGDDVNAPKIPGGAGASQGPGGFGPGGGPGGGGPGGGSSSPEIKAIMVKLNKGPNSLGTLLDGELKAEKPAWETIQPQTKEYAQLAADMVKHEPSRGTKESWAKLAAAYAESAAELDKSAQAKDKDASRDAYTELTNSCMACHRQHRGGPGMGGMGGPPGGGPGGPRGGGRAKFAPPPGGPAPQGGGDATPPGKNENPK
jgi:Cytochrome C'